MRSGSWSWPANSPTASSPARAQNSIRKRLKNMPVMVPNRAAYSSLAELAVCIMGAEAVIDTRLATTMARMVYQAYSLVVTDPNRLNM